jgi:hypothetical protein
LPAEIRHVVFSPAEAAAAVREYRRRIGQPLPVGGLRRIEIQPGKSGVQATLDIAADDGEPSRWECAGAELAEALYAYCEAHMIPLPRAGTKGLQCFGPNLLLIITLNLQGAGWPLSAGLSRCRAEA